MPAPSQLTGQNLPPPRPPAAGDRAARRAGGRPPGRRARAGWTAVVLTSLAIAAFSLSLYAQAGLESLAEDEQGLAETYADRPGAVQAVFYTHVVSASLALLLGPWQFLRALRRRSPRVHRVTGRIYLVAVLTGAGSGLALAPWNSAGMVGFFGFGMLAVLWAVTAVRAYRAVRGGDPAGHQAWMMRNFAFTFAAVTLRLWVGVLTGVQVPFTAEDVDPDVLFDNAYHAVPFLCWVPNMFVAEWLIRRRGLPSYRIR
ncbi:DUF2306 domain-containing protein [Streptomyces aidingensis]|uniref:Uncharacterized membrane protein n=1 Tax=Streptomyces aidingensis TaxID=910347 RepID=A0A1I1HDH0_9ACTN|nr:DUF2306 domain-containing protein [Streptomyces aidingensis]SFC21984.1 Uncharacterized membrane protein [Streptomyces aidingensis]